MSRPLVVVLDDDPTGTQAVADVPVVIDPTVENLAWAFERAETGFFVLTNSRSLDVRAMRTLIRGIVARVLDAAGGRPVRIVSRSDSTLRGHIVAEPDAIADERAARGQDRPETVLFVPAFPAAARITRGGVHLLEQDGVLRPVHETHYATDATFGYTTSVLAELVAELSGGAVAAGAVAVLAADDGLSARVERTIAAGTSAWVVADAEEEKDLTAIVDGLERADPSGARVVVRCSPGLLPALFHAPRGGELAPVGQERRAGGLVITGSHVAQTTIQLERLLGEPNVTGIELDVRRLREATAAEEDDLVAEVADRAGEAMEKGHAVVYTSRDVLADADPERSLAFARRVSRALVAVTARILDRRPPTFLVAKGGITSSDIVSEAVGAHRAVVRGRIGPAIVWEPVDSERWAGPVALVPGNIGGPDGLVVAVRGMAHQRPSGE